MDTKRLIIIASILSVLCPTFAAHAALSFVQSKSNAWGYATGGTVVLNSPTTAGDTIVVSIFSGGSFNTPTDTAGNKYTAIGTASPGFQGMKLYYATSTASATSVSCTASQAYIQCTVFEISGVNNSHPIDASSTFSTSTSAYTFATSSPLTTHNANDLLLYTAGSGNNTTSNASSVSPYTVPSGATSTTGGYTLITEYNIVSTTLSSTTATVQFNGTTNYGGIFVAFQAASSTPATKNVDPLACIDAF